MVDLGGVKQNGLAWFVLDLNGSVGLVIVDLGSTERFMLNILSLVGTGF